MWKYRLQFKMIETSTIWEIMVKLIPGNTGIPGRFRGDSGEIQEIPRDSEEFKKSVEL